MSRHVGSSPAPRPAIHDREDSGIAAPRPMSAADPLGRALIALEVRDCGCRLSKLCHVELARVRGKRPPKGPDGKELKCPGKDRCRECPPSADLSNPCPHLAPVDHTLPLDEWADALLGYDRHGYDDREDAEPAMALTKDARLALYFLRAREGRELFCEGDVLSGDLDEVSVQGELGLHEAGLRASREAEPEPEELRPWGRPPTDWARKAAEGAAQNQSPPERPT